MRILIVDDELVSREKLRKIMGSFGQCVVVENGADALRVATSQNPPDLILLDIIMPGMDGYEVCKRLKANRRTSNIPVIFISAKSREDDEAQGLELGAVDYITKPFSPSIVKARVRTHLELKKYHNRLEELVNERTVELKKATKVTQVEIAERKQAEEALRESEEKYRLLIENATDAIFIAQDEILKFTNPRAEEMTGYSAKELAKIHFSDLIHPEDRDMVLERHIKRLKGEEFPSIYSFRILNRHGEELSVELNVVLINWEGRPATLNFLRDITAQKRLESRLHQAQKMEAIGTLAGGIAHDFNNILGGIMGYAELAKIKLPEESKVLADLEQVIKSSKRAADLIRQILTVSRQHKKEQRPVQVRYIVNEALKLLRATLPTTIEIREDLAKDTSVINADPTQMHQVIMNLCTNAGHAMQEDGGVLKIELANVELDVIEAARHLDINPGSYLRLTVSDTGHGMRFDIMERIFDPYFTTKDTGEGTGLGLSVAQGIVKAHGGTISVYSKPGKGTTFHVYLPVILEEEREEKKSEGPLPTGSERILFIDDEQVLVEIGSRMLEWLGYEVVTKKSSVQALELFRTEPARFDLVITDMTMPHMTGDKLTQELIKIRPDIPVILCTGHTKQISEEKAKGLGIRAFVMKPISNRVMAETVRKVLDAGRSEV